MKMILKKKYMNTDYVCTQINGKPISPDYVSKHFHVANKSKMQIANALDANFTPFEQKNSNNPPKLCAEGSSPFMFMILFFCFRLFQFRDQPAAECQHRQEHLS